MKNQSQDQLRSEEALSSQSQVEERHNQPMMHSQTELKPTETSRSMQQQAAGAVNANSSSDFRLVGDYLSSGAQPLEVEDLQYGRRKTFQHKLRQDDEIKEKQIQPTHLQAAGLDYVAFEETKSNLGANATQQQNWQTQETQKSDRVINDTLNDGASLFSQNVPNSRQNTYQIQKNGLNFSYEGDKNDQHVNKDSSIRFSCITEPNTKLLQGSHYKDSPHEASNLGVVSLTQVAPSEHGFITASQASLVRVDLSEDEHRVFATSQVTDREFRATATFRSGADFLHESPTNAQDYERVSSRKSDTKDEARQNVKQILSQHKQNPDQDPVMTADAKDEANNIQKSSLTPVREVISPFENSRDPSKMITAANNSREISGVCSKVERDNQTQQCVMTVKKNDSGNSSEQITQSAAVKGNFVQTDLSDPCVNHDSQQSSHMSHFLHQIVDEDNNKSAFLKDPRPRVNPPHRSNTSGMKNDNMVHLTSNLTEKVLQTGAMPTQVSAIESLDMMQEHSKESNDLNAISSQQLEYSKSNIGMEAQSRMSQIPNVDSQVAMDDYNDQQQQQPNYESDQNDDHQTSRSSRFSKQHHSKISADMHRNTSPIEEKKEVGKSGQSPYQKSGAEVHPHSNYSQNQNLKQSIGTIYNVLASSQAPEGVIKIINEDQIGENEDEESVIKDSRQINNSSKQKSIISSSLQSQVQVRVCSRFSKGLNEELDRVAENIHRSIAQPDNAASQTITNESLSIHLEDCAEEYYDEGGHSRQDSSCLPKHARSVSNKPKASGKTSRRKKLKSKRGPDSTKRVHIQEVNMLVRDQSTSRINQRVVGQRRKEPRLPDPADESRLRFSTPRRNGSQQSPSSYQNGAIDGLGGDHANSIEVKKHHAVRGSILRNRIDQQSKKNGGQTITYPANAHMQQVDNPDDSIQESSNRDARRNRRLGASKKNSISNASLTLSRSNERSTDRLPKRRIKKRKRGRNHSKEEKITFSDGLREKFHNLNIREGKNNVSRAQKNTKRDLQNSSKNQKQHTGANNKLKNQNQPNAHNVSQRASQVKNYNTSVSEINESSMISGVNQNKSAMIDFQYYGKKLTPRCGIQHSSIDFNDCTQSSINMSQHQQQQHAIQNLPIEMIYQKLSQNWNKDKMMFEQRCQRVLNDSKFEADQKNSSTMITHEEAKTRKQRFDLLKQRLLENNSGDKSVHNRNIVRGRGRVFLEDSLAQQQAAITQNLMELDKMYMVKDQKTHKHISKIGKFQLIFNKPLDRFNLPPSPSHSNPPRAGGNWHKISQQSDQNSAQQSQLQFHQSNAANLHGQARQRSQVLSPNRQAGNFIESTLSSNNQQVMAINQNTTPMNEGPLIDIQASRSKRACFESQSKSLNSTAANINFNSGRVYNANYPNQEVSSSLPQAAQQCVRAATANNEGGKRTKNFVSDNFNSSVGFKSFDSMGGKRNNRALNHTNNMIIKSQDQRQQNISNMSPTSIDTDQNRLLQKLQYRSMRGRRIQEFLKQVQSQKLQQNQSSPNDNTSVDRTQPEQEYQDVVVTPSEGAFSSGLPKMYYSNQIKKKMANRSDYSRTFLSNKLKKKAWAANQSDGGESNLSIIHQQQSVSIDNAAWLPSAKNRNRDDGSVIQSLDTATGNEVFKSFLAQQDKRIDFGYCPLYLKVSEGKNLNFEQEIGSNKLMGSMQLESLMNLMRQKNKQTLTRQFLLRNHQECFDTILFLLNELGMGYRASRMQRNEAQIDIERVYIMTCRAHKLHRARRELIEIFRMIQKLEELLPAVKQLALSKLGSVSSQEQSSRYGAGVNDAGEADDIVVNHADDKQVELQSNSNDLRTLMSRLVIRIPSLLKTFKFFNDSFVFIDRDYQKYLSKEFIEIKGMLSSVNIIF